MTGTAIVVHSDPEILVGTPGFVGTRVPLRTFSTISRVVITLMSLSKLFRQCRGHRPLRSVKTLTGS
jgi:hypothetical protein